MFCGANGLHQERGPNWPTFVMQVQNFRPRSDVNLFVPCQDLKCIYPSVVNFGIGNRRQLFAGSWMGNVIALPLSGYLCENGFNDGWPSVFYVIGE